MIALALFAVAGLATPSRDDPPPRPGPQATLRVLSGRASLARGDRIVQLTPRDGPRTVRGEGYVELAPRGEILLLWSGLSSLRLRGPAAFEWELEAGEPTRPVVRVLRLRSLEAEVRRGSVELLLPEGWTLSVSPGALRASGLPSGAIELRHHGGSQTGIRSRIPREGQWPSRIGPGQRVRLSAARPPRGRAGSGAPRRGPRRRTPG